MATDPSPEIIAEMASTVGNAMITRQSPEAIALAWWRVAAPAIRAAAVEQERASADVLKLGGMAIDIAVATAMEAFGLTYAETPPATMRALRDLYRAGIYGGFDIARSTGAEQPEVVDAIRAQERERIQQLAMRAGATYCPVCITEPMPAHGGHPNWDHPFADLIGGE